ncbi:hypothetical protein TVAG_425520 [Trichomonas vaginalis G3]|uniref:Uncharacterized protein n=1 Tax=Trichomonas vaginalis (strain ATCC PRA-98 / G3) TaxID=412133 RepID=A2FI86_TRIV3|nr:hypothetical protein TVAGG3_0723250 [Trichomonas vaginalis G3]EAX95368.1 hypothetical protein TVAG_425520 [Trichomonas vaginalis G3]KAI5510736.1 hypothetical protein TVAGG3_0723250 [Trichomonas vaginalis G3]|eukprot:XP_001308298.1 hypothetical protein [Trichomonas vaginalis G3]
MKSVLAEETQKVSNLRGILANLQVKNKELESELEKEKEKGNVTGLRQTAKNVLKYLRLKKQENQIGTSENSKKAEEEEKFLKYIGQTNAASDNYLIETIDNLLNDPSCTECRKCQDYESQFVKLSRILGTSTVIEEAQTLVNRLHQSEKTEGKLQQEIQELKKENSEFSMTITKILQLFNISQSLSSFTNQSGNNYSSNNSVSDAICGVVGKEVAKLTETIRHIEDERKRDKVLVSKRLIDYFGVRIDDNLLAQIDEVKLKFNQNEKRMSELSNFCEDIERRPCLLLGVEKPNRAIFDSIRFLFSSLETRQNPLQSTVDILQQEISTSETNFVDCERSAARILREKLQDVSNTPLSERIFRLSKQLRAIE